MEVQTTTIVNHVPDDGQFDQTPSLKVNRVKVT
jgi:hypothetical protein